jgi:hypothetical protein
MMRKQCPKHVETLNNNKVKVKVKFVSSWLCLLRNYLTKLIHENNGSLEYLDKGANTAIVKFFKQFKITGREIQVFKP